MPRLQRGTRGFKDHGTVTSAPQGDGKRPDAQKAVIGKPLTPESIAAAAEAAFRPAKPLDNTDFHMTWRKEMVRRYVAGALEEIRANG